MLSTSAVEILNNYFDKILLLTIERNLYRLPAIEKNFNGLNFEVFMGVDGNSLNIQKMQESGEVSFNINDIYKKNNIDYLNLKVGNLLKNQIAVASSHKKMYEYIIRNKFSKVLILEDDTVPVEENLKYLAQTLAQLPKDCELLFLGHIYNNDFSIKGSLKYNYLVNILYKLGLRTERIKRKRKNYPKKFSSLLKKQGAHIGTHAYALLNGGAEKLLKLQTPLRYGASDLLLMDAVSENLISSYTCKYMFFKQNADLPSSVYNN